MDDLRWMAEALAEARRAAELGEVPVGAVVVDGAGEIVAPGPQPKETNGIRSATPRSWRCARRRRELGGWRLSGCTLYVTLEPCAMCAGALVHSRVERLVFGAADPKAGFCGSLGDLVRDPRLNHRLEVTSGVLREECAAMLQEFFAALRQGVVKRSERGRTSKASNHGEVTEWLKEHAWKACVGETLPWVRIPPSPPTRSLRSLLGGEGGLLAGEPQTCGLAALGANPSRRPARFARGGQLAEPLASLAAGGQCALNVGQSFEPVRW